MDSYRRTLLLVTCIALFGSTVYSEILNYDNPDCIIDAELPPEEEGNYVDCNTPENIAADETRCCDVEGAKGCCSTETKTDKLMIICTTIGIVTASVATACFIVFWCNPTTMPCCKKFCPCCIKKNEEFGEMTDLSDEIKRVGASNEAYLRDSQYDEYAPPEKYDMPEELKGNVTDDWWGSSSGGASAF